MGVGRRPPRGARELGDTLTRRGSCDRCTLRPCCERDAGAGSFCRSLPVERATGMGALCWKIANVGRLPTDISIKLHTRAMQRRGKWHSRFCVFDCGWARSLRLVAPVLEHETHAHLRRRAMSISFICATAFQRHHRAEMPATPAPLRIQPLFLHGSLWSCRYCDGRCSVV